LAGLACPTANECTAVDLQGQAMTFDPSAPGNPEPATIDSGNSL